MIAPYQAPHPPVRAAAILIAGLASTAVLVADRAAVAASDQDEQFMRLALEEARLGDYPFGAVIVRDREVIARGRNLGK